MCRFVFIVHSMSRPIRRLLLLYLISVRLYFPFDITVQYVSFGAYYFWLFVLSSLFPTRCYPIFRFICRPFFVPFNVDIQHSVDFFLFDVLLMHLFIELLKSQIITKRCYFVSEQVGMGTCKLSFLGLKKNPESVKKGDPDGAGSYISPCLHRACQFQGVLL